MPHLVSHGVFPLTVGSTFFSIQFPHMQMFTFLFVYLGDSLSLLSSFPHDLVISGHKLLLLRTMCDDFMKKSFYLRVKKESLKRTSVPNPSFLLTFILITKS